jgi:5-formyltetrahydrofolate cyclo-ligase
MQGDPKDPPGALAERKADLRRRMRSARSALPLDVRRELAARAVEHLLSLPELEAARTVMVFYSFGAELSTGGLIQRLHHVGRRVLLPFLDDSGTMEAAELLPTDALVATTYGPKEPPRRTPVNPGEVDLVVTPGLAFDRLGHRLGYGGGHYDRFLRRLRGGVPRIGIAFAVQLLEDVPAGEADQMVNAVVTEEGVTRSGVRDIL